MSKITHTMLQRVAQNATNVSIANVTVSASGAVVNLAGTGLSTLSASTSPGAGITCVASAISGNAATVTFGGTPKAGDVYTITVNGQSISGNVSMQNSSIPLSAIAATAAGLLQVLINGDMLAILQANKGVVQTTTTRANCQTPGLLYTTKTDLRNTTAGPVINDSETSVP